MKWEWQREKKMKHSQTDKVDRERFSSLSNEIMHLHQSQERLKQQMKRHDDVISSRCEAEVEEKMCNHETDYAKREDK